MILPLEILEKQNNRHQVSYRMLVLGALGVALALRLWAFFSLRHSIYFDHLLIDERVYHNWAVQIANGTWNSVDVYEFSPLFAYFMALVYKLFGSDITLVRLANILFGVLTCLFIGFIGKEIGGRRVGLISLFAAAMYSPMILYSIVPLKTAMSLMLFALFVWLFFRLLNNGSHWSEYLMTGIVAGLMMNVRPNYLIILPLVMALVVYFGFRDGLPAIRLVINSVLLTAGFTFAVLPFVLRNYFVAGDAALMVTQSGFNLHIGNNPDNSSPYYRPEPFASSSPLRQSIHFNIEASKRAGKKLSPQESASFWRDEVFRIALQQPALFARKLAQKALALGNRYEAGDHYHTGFLKEFVPFFKLPLLSFAVIFPLGMAGMAAGAFRNRKVAAGALVFALYGLSLVLFFSVDRYRLPLLVILIPFAAYGCRRLYSYVGKGALRPAAASALIILIFAVVEFLPLEGTGDMSAYYNTHALILHARGKKEEAVKYWKTSSQMHKAYSPYADLALARYYHRKGDLTQAVFHLDIIAENSFAASAKYEMMGDITLGRKRTGEAAAYFRKALEVNSGNMTARKKLISILRKIDSAEAVREYARLKEIAMYYK